MQETQETLVLSLGWEDPLEKEMATDSTHEQRSLVGYSPWGCKESDTTERLHFHFTTLETNLVNSFIFSTRFEG